MIIYFQLHKSEGAMLLVYICEDDTVQLKRLKKLITETLESEKIAGDVEIACATHDPLEVLDRLRHATNSGIYFLDVQLGEGIMSGIDLGVNINTLDPKAYIVMVTVHADAAPIIFEYKVGAKDYILKDHANFPERIKECILDAHNLSKSKVIEFSDFMVAVDEIRYIQSSAESKKMIYIHGKHKIRIAHVTLNEIEKKLNNSFFKCHRTHIVNLKYIIWINKVKHNLTLENGEEIPVSWRKLKELESRYVNYINK